MPFFGPGFWGRIFSFGAGIRPQNFAPRNPAPSNLWDVITYNHEFCSRYFRESHNRVLDKMLVVSDGLVDAIVNECDIFPEDEDNVLFEMDDKEKFEEPNSVTESSVSELVLLDNIANIATSPTVPKEIFSLDDYPKSAAIPSSCLSLLNHLLRTVPFIFGRTRAQVVPMIIHRTASENDTGEVISSIISFQRLIAWITYKVFKSLCECSSSVVFQHIPHKLRRRQGRELRDCWTTRFALEVLNPDSREMYAYLGGGVPWDPPFGYGLVFRELPIHVAERIAAVVLFLAVGVVDPKMITMKPATDPSKKCTAAEKNELLHDVANNITCHLSFLFDRFGSRQELLRYCCNSSSTDVGNMNFCNVAKTSRDCIICQGSGLLLGYLTSKNTHSINMEPCPLCYE